MLPRAGRPHDQPLRTEWVAGLGGLLVGHIGWLVAISLAIATPRVNFWVLIVAAVIGALGAIAFFLGWRLYQRKSYGWATFLLALPISPVLFTLIVLGVTYL